MTWAVQLQPHNLLQDAKLTCDFWVHAWLALTKPLTLAATLLADPALANLELAWICLQNVWWLQFWCAFKNLHTWWLQTASRFTWINCVVIETPKCWLAPFRRLGKWKGFVRILSGLCLAHLRASASFKTWGLSVQLLQNPGDHHWEAYHCSTSPLLDVPTLKWGSGNHPEDALCSCP